MKNLIKIVCSTLFVASLFIGFLYLLFSLCCWSFNTKEWGKKDDGIVNFAFSLLSIIATVISAILHEKYFKQK